MPYVAPGHVAPGHQPITPDNRLRHPAREMEGTTMPTQAAIPLTLRNKHVKGLPLPSPA